MIGQNMIKVESITDEFVTLQKTGDQLAQLDAVIEKGEMDDSFKIQDTNVNSRMRMHRMGEMIMIKRKQKQKQKEAVKANPQEGRGELFFPWEISELLWGCKRCSFTLKTNASSGGTGTLFI